MNASQNIHHTGLQEEIKQQAIRNFSSSPRQINNLKTFQMSNEESSSHKSGHFNAEDQETIDDVQRNPKVSILNNDANFQTTFQNFNTNLRKSSEALRQSTEALNKFTNDSIDKKENCEPNTKKVISSQLRESFHQEMHASKLQ